MATKPNNHESEYDDPLDEDLDEIDESEEESGSEEDIGTSTVTEEAGEEREAGADDAVEGEEPDKEREAIRARRREERKAKKVAAREREDWLRAELSARDQIIDQMRQQLNGITSQSQQSEVDKAERAKQEAAQAYAYWKEQIKVGTESQNGSLVAEATEKMLSAQNRFGQADAYQRNLRQVAQQKAPAQLDPRLVNYAKNWVDNNPWYSLNGTDSDSRRVAAIDSSLESEGYNPTTPEYWAELTDRVKSALPHRFKGATLSTSKPKSVVSGSGRNGANGTNSAQTGSVKGLSAERVQALKDAGLWDDPKKRSAAIKEFQAYDKANRI